MHEKQTVSEASDLRRPYRNRARRTKTPLPALGAARAAPLPVSDARCGWRRSAIWVGQWLTICRPLDFRNLFLYNVNVGVVPGVELWGRRR